MKKNRDILNGVGLAGAVMAVVMIMAATLPVTELRVVDDTDVSNYTTITNDGTNMDVSTGMDVAGAVAATGAISGTTGTFTGNVVVDVTTLMVDTSGNRVGIGTASPDYKLHIVDGTAPGIRFEKTVSNAGTAEIGSHYGGNLYLNPSSGYTNFYGGNLDHALQIFADTTGTVRIHSNGNSYFNGGNVGIGDSSPDAKLDVAGNAIVEDELRVGDFIEMAAVTEPAAPTSGVRIYVDSTTGDVCAIDSTGTTTTLGTF